jgi:hypothetical protein
MSREILTQALEALEYAAERVYSETNDDAIGTAITAIRAHLDAPEQEPVAKCTESDQWNCKYCNKTKTCAALADPRNHGTPKQEPYAWSYTSKINGDEVLTHQPPDRVIEPEQFHIQPLYLHPAPIPPGMVLVPEELTEAILDVMLGCADGRLNFTVVEAYKAMLAAAKGE